MIDIYLDDFNTPKDCEDAIMILHGVKNAIRTRNYQRTFALLSEARRNQLLDDVLFTYKWALANIEQDKESQKDMKLFCAECHKPSGKYLLCPSCEAKRTRYPKDNTIKNENTPTKVQEISEKDNKPKKNKESEKAEDRGNSQSREGLL